MKPDTRIIDMTSSEFSEMISEVVKRELALTQPQQSQEPEELLTVAQAASFLKCSKVSLFKWIKADKIIYMRIGGNRLRFKKSDLLKTIETKKGKKGGMKT